jgi:hypothetical protein
VIAEPPLATPRGPLALALALRIGGATAPSIPRLSWRAPRRRSPRQSARSRSPS